MWILNEALDQSKLNPKSDKHTFIGYQDGSKAIKYYDVCTCLVKISRNYTFQIKTAPQVNIPVLDVQHEWESTGTNALYLKPNNIKGTTTTHETTKKTHQKWKWEEEPV